MPDVGLLAIKALNGGVFVAAFAVVAEPLVPKRFAGLFSASPAVALANLTVIVVDKGSRVAALDAAGMIAGAVAVTVACLLCIKVVRRIGAVRGSIVLWCVWGLVAEVAYFAVVR